MAYIKDRIISGWWFGTFFIFPYIGNNHPNWLIFFRGVETTNQLRLVLYWLFTVEGYIGTSPVWWSPRRRPWPLAASASPVAVASPRAAPAFWGPRWLEPCLARLGKMRGRWWAKFQRGGNEGNIYGKSLWTSMKVQVARWTAWEKPLGTPAKNRGEHGPAQVTGGSVRSSSATSSMTMLFERFNEKLGDEVTMKWAPRERWQLVLTAIDWSYQRWF